MDLLWDILTSMWEVTGAMAPYLLLGFLVAGVLSAFVSPESVERHLGRRGFWQITKAALLGVPLPLCSCGVIPVAASLRRHGAGKGATVSFLASTPQTGVDSIMVTYALLGPVFAVFRVVMAFLAGLVGGMVVEAVDRDDTDAGGGEGPCACHAPGRRGRVAQVFHYGFLTLPRDIGKALVFGLVLAGVLSALIPDDYFADRLGSGFATMLVMMAVGIPLYVCSTGSVPIAFTLMRAGVSPGGALVFLICGPATNAATVTTMWKLLGRRATIVYLLTIAVCALAGGLVLDRILDSPGAGAGHAMHGGLSPWLRNLSAAVLLGLLVVNMALDRFAQPRASED